jgi:hypothetical protein
LKSAARRDQPSAGGGIDDVSFDLVFDHPGHKGLDA